MSGARLRGGRHHGKPMYPDGFDYRKCPECGSVASWFSRNQRDPYRPYRECNDCKRLWCHWDEAERWYDDEAFRREMNTLRD